MTFTELIEAIDAQAQQLAVPVGTYSVHISMEGEGWDVALESEVTGVGVGVHSGCLWLEVPELKFHLDSDYAKERLAEIIADGKRQAEFDGWTAFGALDEVTEKIDDPYTLGVVRSVQDWLEAKAAHITGAVWPGEYVESIGSPRESGGRS